MTIFVEVAKRFVELILNGTAEDSIALDNHILIGIFRNLKLSEEQRRHLHELQREIEAFSEKNTDKESLDALKNIISEKKLLIDKCKEKQGHNDKEATDKALDFINTILDKLYREILGKVDFPLLDVKIENAKDPFVILCINAAYYLGEQAIFPSTDGVLAKIGTKILDKVAPKTSVEVTSEKRNLTIRQLKSCKRFLVGHDSNKETYKELVIQAIRNIAIGNVAICEKAKVSFKIPVLSWLSFSVFNTKIEPGGPTPGRLKTAMVKACMELGIPADEIENLLKGEEPAAEAVFQ